MIKHNNNNNTNNTTNTNNTNSTKNKGTFCWFGHCFRGTWNHPPPLPQKKKAKWAPLDHQASKKRAMAARFLAISTCRPRKSPSRSLGSGARKIPSSRARKARSKSRRGSAPMASLVLLRARLKVWALFLRLFSRSGRSVFQDAF